MPRLRKEQSKRLQDLYAKYKEVEKALNDAQIEILKETGYYNKTELGYVLYDEWIARKKKHKIRLCWRTRFHINEFNNYETIGGYLYSVDKNNKIGNQIHLMGLQNIHFEPFDLTTTTVDDARKIVAKMKKEIEKANQEMDVNNSDDKDWTVDIMESIKF